MPYKVILEFAGRSYKGPVGGWSEDYYFPAASPPQAIGIAEVLAQARSSFLLPTYTITHIRVSDTDTPALAQLKRENFVGLFTPSGWSSLITGQLWAAALCTLYGANGTPKRKLMVRGIPAEVLTSSQAGDLVPVFGAFRSALLLYLTNINILGGLIRAKTKSPQPPTFRIRAVTVGPVTTTIVLNQVAGLEVGQRVHLYNLRSFEGLSGDRVIRTIDTPTATVTVDTLNAEPGIYQGRGYLWPVAYTYSPVLSGSFDGFTHRDTGRPFGLQRGRRRQPTI